MGLFDCVLMDRSVDILFLFDCAPKLDNIFLDHMVTRPYRLYNTMAIFTITHSMNTVQI